MIFAVFHARQKKFVCPTKLILCFETFFANREKLSSFVVCPANKKPFGNKNRNLLIRLWSTHEVRAKKQSKNFLMEEPFKI